MVDGRADRTPTATRPPLSIKLSGDHRCVNVMRDDRTVQCGTTGDGFSTSRRDARRVRAHSKARCDRERIACTHVEPCVVAYVGVVGAAAGGITSHVPSRDLVGGSELAPPAARRVEARPSARGPVGDRRPRRRRRAARARPDRRDAPPTGAGGSTCRMLAACARASSRWAVFGGPFQLGRPLRRPKAFCRSWRCRPRRA